MIYAGLLLGALLGAAATALVMRRRAAELDAQLTRWLAENGELESEVQALRFQLDPKAPAHLKSANRTASVRGTVVLIDFAYQEGYDDALAGRPRKERVRRTTVPHGIA